MNTLSQKGSHLLPLLSNTLQFFVKLRKGPNWTLRGPEETESLKNLNLKISCQGPFNTYNFPWNVFLEKVKIPVTLIDLKRPILFCRLLIWLQEPLSHQLLGASSACYTERRKIKKVLRVVRAKIRWHQTAWPRAFHSVYFPHRVHIFTRDETGLLCLPTQLERTLQLYWWW